MLIKLLTPQGDLEIDLFPSVIHKTHYEILDYPEVEFNSDIDPITHSIELVASLEVIIDEYGITGR